MCKHHVVEAYLCQLLRRVDAIEVDVIDLQWFAVERSTGVLVDDGKRWTRYEVVYREILADAFDELRLARTKITLECNHIANTQSVGKLLPYLNCLGFAMRPEV